MMGNQNARTDFVCRSEVKLVAKLDQISCAAAVFSIIPLCTIASLPDMCGGHWLCRVCLGGQAGVRYPGDQCPGRPSAHSANFTTLPTARIGWMPLLLCQHGDTAES